ncbi:hypothetical protein [Actinokineospora sp. NBRC 105648]|uniref:hypothetical protein n=1 Tax=Actinokineospora sp. NBRC 105648 TaxID=3032206 RepID=UPI0024A1B569|nr:hypothetical protein [Actinokineospora sp. NBRC 105648]GLZ41499.1 hypothetical protein Acsp05_51230 [Actinokineospora sp. NBRC 105648]
MSEATSLQLAERLFVPQERWGWEYVAPAPATRSPDADRMPVWHEPPLPDVSALEHKVAVGKSQLLRRAGASAVLWIIVSVASPGAGIAVLVAGIAFSYVLPVLLPSRKIKEVLAGAQAEREAGHRQFLLAQRQWQAGIGEHDRAEAARRAAALLWHPLDLWSGPSRVDVFGGTGDGWAGLLATLGTSLTGMGAPITVVDFSEQRVAGGLAAFVASRGLPVRHTALPEDAARVSLLAGIDPDEVADLLAQAVHTMRQSDQVDLRALDTDLIEAVAKRLVRPPTFQRLVAGLEVLRRTYDLAEDGPLDVAEVTKITAYVDTLGQTERVQQELQFLISTLSLLAKDEPVAEDPDTTGLWHADGLSVITTAHSQHRRKDFLDRVVFHRLLHDVRGRRAGADDGVLVVAGADQIGLEGLESFARQCKRVGIRLVLLLERLRGDLKELLGSADSAAILMRLGNAQDASAAAEFIGRGHKFELSQVTAQFGKSVAKGTGRTVGETEGTSETHGTSSTKGRSWNQGAGSFLADSFGGSNSFTRNDSVTESRSQTWQETVNETASESVTDGTTHVRVYEFAVEPTTIQSLPTTAFVLVENPPSGRRVVLGDCNPGITLLERVAADPRRG